MFGHIQKIPGSTPTLQPKDDAELEYNRKSHLLVQIQLTSMFRFGLSADSISLCMRWPDGWVLS